MIQITLKSPGGDPVAEVLLPSHAGELSLQRYISFLNELKPEKQGNHLRVMARAISELTGVSMEDIFKAELGDEWDGVDSVDSIEQGIRSMYGWAVKVIGEYRGMLRAAQSCSFEYKGETYSIPIIVQSAIGGQPMLPSINTGDSIEAMETVRTFEAEIKKTKDENGNLIFTQYLRLIAILCKKEDEMLPEDDDERETWIQQRAFYFSDIDTATALDVDFFLLNLSTPSELTHPAIGFLTLQSLILVGELQKKSRQDPKPTQKLSRIKKRLVSASVGARSF